MDRRGLIEQPFAHIPVGPRPCTTHMAMAAQQRCDRPFCLACLQHVGRWLVCTRCLEELQRERSSGSLLGRWRRRTEVGAGAIIVLLVVGLFGLVLHLLGPTGSDTLAHADGPAHRPVATDAGRRRHLSWSLAAEKRPLLRLPSQ